LNQSGSFASECRLMLPPRVPSSLSILPQTVKHYFCTCGRFARHETP
jgi:hypothetical protein